jgi:CBS domain containing-hemolysin-like protein
MSGWYLLLAFLFVVANGFFVAAEFALVKVRATQLAEMAAEGNVRAEMARKIARKLDSYLSATQLGVTLASLALGWVGEPAFASLLEPRLVRFGVFGSPMAHWGRSTSPSTSRSASRSGWRIRCAASTSSPSR